MGKKEHRRWRHLALQHPSMSKKERPRWRHLALQRLGDAAGGPAASAAQPGVALAVPVACSPKPLRVASDFAGMASEMIALQNMKVAAKLVHASEAHRRTRAFLRSNYNPDVLVTSASESTSRLPPDIDLYVGTPPCVSFSTAGLREAWNGAQGQHIWTCVHTIRHSRPRCFLLENVPQLESCDGGEGLRSVVYALEAANYDVSHFVTCASAHGLPVRRRRLYIVGVLRSGQCCTACRFIEPVELGAPMELGTLLGPRRPGECAAGRPAPTQRSATEAVIEGLARCEERGIDPDGSDRVLDIDAAPAARRLATALAPCLRHCRRKGAWLLARGRRIELMEAAALHGIPPGAVRWTGSAAQSFGLLGNGMACSVLERILRELIRVANLRKTVPRDRWADGTAAPALAAALSGARMLLKDR